MAGQDSNTNQPFNPRIQNFLEQLRQRSSSRAYSDELTPSNFNFESFRKEKQLQEIRRQEFHTSRRREFNEIFSLSKNREQKRIEEIRQQVVGLTASIKKLHQEVRVAAIQTVAAPGRSDESFFDYLLQTIKLIKKRVEDSSSWLSLYNQRSKKKGYYWAMASQNGNKFMSAEERAIATSMG